jgi:hypothetical protein
MVKIKLTKNPIPKVEAGSDVDTEMPDVETLAM